jgi:hypothetical protein
MEHVDTESTSECNTYFFKKHGIICLKRNLST